MIVDSAYYRDGARQGDGPLSVDEAGRRSREEVGFVWLVLRDPAPEELDELQIAFDLPALAVEDAREGHQRPKVEHYQDALFVAVKTVRYDEDGRQPRLGELDIFLGAHHAILVGGDTATSNGVRARLDADPGVAQAGPMAAAWAVLDEVIDGYEPVLDRLGDDLDETEQALFQGGTDQGEHIYLQHRRAARLVRALHPLLVPFDAVERGDVELVPEQLRPLFRDVGDHVRRLYEDVVLLDEALVALLSTNLAGVTLRQNVVVQKVSGWAAIAAVPTIITGIYGMNFRHMPELGWPWGYPLVLVVMIIVVYGLWWNFKRVGWL